MFFPQIVLSTMFFPRMCCRLTGRSVEKNMISSTFWEKHDWQHILGKNMISSTFWGKKHGWQHILGKNMVDSTIWGKNMIGSTFWEKYIIRSKFSGKT
jgi:hypothetical protein